MLTVLEGSKDGPTPAGLIDRKLPGGAGVMLDDVAAGLYTRGVLALIFRG